MKWFFCEIFDCVHKTALTFRKSLLVSLLCKICMCPKEIELRLKEEKVKKKKASLGLEKLTPWKKTKYIQEDFLSKFLRIVCYEYLSL